MMDEDQPHRLLRMRYPDPPNKAERDAFAKEVLECAKWFRSPQGRSAMTERGYRPQSVATAMIEDILTLAGEAGMSPLEILCNATFRYYAAQSHKRREVRKVAFFIEEILDEADRESEKAEASG